MPPKEKTNTHTARAVALAEDFVSTHYSLLGAIELHRHALGWDLLRAPANVALAPIYLASRLAALSLRTVGLRRAGNWLAGRRIYLRSAVSRAVEAAVWREVVGKRHDLISEPTVKERSLVQDYTDVRSAISEIFTSMLFLLVGYLVFQTATPGVISLAPVVSDFTATSAARETFPLGQRLGGLWYHVFPVNVPLWFIVTTGVLLAAGASVVTTFAGVIADPVQAYTGVHRRRLLRLLEQIDAESERPPPLAREHVLARFADITDAGVSLLRSFRP